MFDGVQEVCERLAIYGAMKGLLTSSIFGDDFAADQTLWCSPEYIIPDLEKRCRRVESLGECQHGLRRFGTTYDELVLCCCTEGQGICIRSKIKRNIDLKKGQTCMVREVVRTSSSTSSYSSSSSTSSVSSVSPCSRLGPAGGHSCTCFHSGPKRDPVTYPFCKTMMMCLSLERYNEEHTGSR
jgi:hypothetical protein